jgi:hypothetical protein
MLGLNPDSQLEKVITKAAIAQVLYCGPIAYPAIRSKLPSDVEALVAKVHA